MASTYINEDLFIAHLKADAKERMIASAEPIIREAMKEVEIKLRESLGSIVIGMIDKDFDIMRQAEHLTIRIRRES